jgi:gluconokinase
VAVFSTATTFHPEDNVAKMAEGLPLTDEDRWPWLDRLAEEMRGIDARGDSAVFACSALKDSYRRRLFVAGNVGWSTSRAMRS